MSPQDFYFALELGGASKARELVNDVITRLLEHAGCSGEISAGVRTAIQAALAAASAQTEAARVQVHAHDGRLHIVVSSSAGEIWRDARDLPCR